MNRLAAGERARRSGHRLLLGVRIAFEILALAFLVAVILVGTLKLEVGPTVLIFESGHGIHLGDVLLVASLLPFIALIGWRLMRDIR